MKLKRIIVNYDAEKLKAIEIFSPKDFNSIEKQLTEYLEKLYQKVVPQPTRTYIEEIAKMENKPPTQNIKKESAKPEA
ncbi:MAG: hypothetical protein BWY15_01741 [Firmicutes bacterium ADurb.Bin193]|nr:MAG: hypothetical protein BWY15_01741 [Firmicutes bacterium ADurb.Bin193]